jgi:hypothetical protein
MTDRATSRRSACPAPARSPVRSRARGAATLTLPEDQKVMTASAAKQVYVVIGYTCNDAAAAGKARCPRHARAKGAQCGAAPTRQAPPPRAPRGRTPQRSATPAPGAAGTMHLAATGKAASFSTDRVEQERASIGAVVDRERATNRSPVLLNRASTLPRHLGNALRIPKITHHKGAYANPPAPESAAPGGHKNWWPPDFRPD